MLHADRFGNTISKRKSRDYLKAQITRCGSRRVGFDGSKRADSSRSRASTGSIAFGEGLHVHHALPTRLRCRSRNPAGSGCRARNDSRIPRACRRFRQRNHRQAHRRTCQGRRAQSRSLVRRRIEGITRAFVRRLESWPQGSEQDDKWSFCLTAGTLCPANQERQ